MRKTLGRKSTGEITLNFVVFIILSITLIILLQYPSETEGFKGVVMLYSAGGVALLMLFLVIHEGLKPSTMIECDQTHLYLHYRRRTETIALKDVLHATPRRRRAKGYNYTFGYVIVHAKYRTYKIGQISSCEEVALDIMREVGRAKSEV